MAVDKAELVSISQGDDDDAQIAATAIKLWDAMLTGKWTVSKERERAAQQVEASGDVVVVQTDLDQTKAELMEVKAQLEAERECQQSAGDGEGNSNGIDEVTRRARGT